MFHIYSIVSVLVWMMEGFKIQPVTWPFRHSTSLLKEHRPEGFLGSSLLRELEGEPDDGNGVQSSNFGNSMLAGRLRQPWHFRRCAWLVVIFMKYTWCHTVVR